MAKTVKTNAARILEKNNAAYKLLSCPSDGVPKSGTEIAAALDIEPSLMYKTLVTRGFSNNHYVFVIPSDSELDLKNAAACVGEKNVEMIPVKKLLETTGYVRGGCSPIGMKKQFVTVFDRSALAHPSIVVSAGKIGYHIETDPNALIAATNGKTADITR